MTISIKYLYEQYFIILAAISIIIGPAIIELLLISNFFYCLILYKTNLKQSIKDNYIILIFFCFVLLSSLFNTYDFSIRGILYIRFYLYFIAIITLLKTGRIIKYSNLLILIWGSVIFDLIFQSIFGFDVFGFESFSYKTSEIDKTIVRLTGPFDDSRAGFYLVIITILIGIELLKNEKILLFFSINLINCCIIPLTGERTSLIFAIILLFSSLLNLAFKKRKEFFGILILLILLTPTLFKLSPDSVIDRNVTLLKYQIENFNNTQWFAHYDTSFKIFQDYKFFGTGVRNFRNICSDDRYDGEFDKKFRCSTHPHNKYLEILSEAGIFSLLIILLIFFKTSINLVRENLNFCSFLILISFTYIIFDPLLPSKSFFNNWMSSIFWILLAIIDNYKIKKN